MDNGPRIICILGIDGVGKTTHAKMLVEYLWNKGIRSEYLWLRFHHMFSLPLLLFCRMAGYTRISTLDGHPCSYHEFYKSRVVSMIYPWVLLIDTAIFTALYAYVAILRGKTIVCDRFIYDTLIDLSVAIKDQEIYKKLIGKLYLSLVPKNTSFVMLDLDKETILARRPELQYDTTFNERYMLYLKYADVFGIKKISNSNEITDVNNTIINHLRV